MKKRSAGIYAMRLLRLLLAAVVGVSMYFYSQVERPVLVNTEGRAFIQAEVTKVLQDNQQENGSRIGDQLVQVRLTTGERKGELLQANCPNGMLFGAVCEPGSHVVLILSQAGGMDSCTVYSLDRTIPVLAFVSLFFLLLCLVGGEKGVRSALALLVTFGCFFLLFFPMLLRGNSPVYAAVLTSLVIVAATLYLIHGWSHKALAAGSAAFGGVVLAGAAALLFGHAAGLSGYNVSNIEALLFVAQNTSIDVGQLLFAGILFASLGAVLDIAMDVTSAVDEIHRRTPELQAKDLFQSGMNVGRDVMGTMSATLILAFFGGSLGVWVLDYAYNLPWLQLLNSNAIGIEIMQGLSGSFGVILTVPLAAGISAGLAKRQGLTKEEQTADWQQRSDFSCIHEKSLDKPNLL